MIKFALKLLAPLIVGLIRRYGPQIPGIDHAQLARNRRRLGAALSFLVLSFVLFAAGVLTAIIDAAVQFEQKGALELNAVMMTAIGAVFGGFVSAVIAKVQFPSFADFAAVARRAQQESDGTLAKSSRATPPRRPEYAH